MAKFNIILDKKRESKDEKYPLRLVINNYNTSATIKLPYRVRENNWNKTKQQINSSCKYYNAMNENVRLLDFKQQLFPLR